MPEDKTVPAGSDNTEEPREARPERPDGDWREPYGYGHRAHQPDPAASYGFNPGVTRVLPVHPRTRWR